MIQTHLRDREASRGKPESSFTRSVSTLTFSFPHLSFVTVAVPEREVYALEERDRNFCPVMDVMRLSEFLSGKGRWDSKESLGVNATDNLQRKSDWQTAFQNKSFTAQVAMELLEKADAPTKKEGPRSTKRKPSR